MAEDIMISVSTDLGEALKNLKELEKSIKATQKSVNDELNPAVNNTGTRISAAGNKIKGFGTKLKGAISTETALAFTALGAGVTSFTKSCIDSAIKSEQEWSRFGALVQQSGGGVWKEMAGGVKDWARDFSNRMGYATSDTREAMTTMMQYGMTLKETKSAMDGVAGLAARTGQTEAEAATMVTSALNGRFTQLSKVTGLQKEDYQLADGSIDKQKLLKDLYEQNTDAIKAHGETTEAQLNRINNAWGGFKTKLGNALMPAVKMVADFVEGIVKWFSGLDKGHQQFIAAFLAIVAVVTTAIGVLGMIAPIIMNVGDLISGFGNFIGKLIPGDKDLSAWQRLKGHISSVKEKISGLNLGEKFTGIKQKVLQGWESMTKKVSALKTKIQGMNLGSKLQGIKQSVVSRWNTLRNRIDSVRQRISSMHLGSKLNGIKTSVLNGWQTIKNRISNVKTAMQGLHLGDKLQGIKQTIISGWRTFKSVINSAKIALLGNAGAEGTSTAATIAHSIANGVRTAATTVATAAQTALNAATAAGLGPILIIVAAIAAFVAILWYLYNNNEQVRNTLNAVADVLKGALMSAWNALGGVITSVANILRSTLAPALTFIKAAFQIVSSTIGQLVNVFSRVMDGSMSLGDAFTAIGQILSNAGTMLFNLAKETARKMLDGFINSVLGETGGVRGAIGNILNTVVQGFLSIPQRVGQAFNTIGLMILARLNWIRAMAGMLVSMLVQAVVTRFNLLVARVRMVFMMVVNAIRTRLNQARAAASMLANMIRQAIVTRFNQIIARVRQIFQRIVSTIRQRLQNAVSAAKEKAREIYEGIKNKVAEIPQAVADEFGKIPDKIRSALDNAKNIAVTKISELVSAVKSALGIASPGFIQRMMAFEFNSIPGIISDSSVLAIREAGKMATGIVDTWQDNMTSLGMPGLSMSGADYSNLVRGQSVDLFGQQPMGRLDTALLTSSMNVPRQPMGSGQGMIQNTTNNSDDHTTHIHVENISLDCNHLTKQESRRILYDALDGLYTGGI